MVKLSEKQELEICRSAEIPENGRRDFVRTINMAVTHYELRKTEGMYKDAENELIQLRKGGPFYVAPHQSRNQPTWQSRGGLEGHQLASQLLVGQSKRADVVEERESRFRMA